MTPILYSFRRCPYAIRARMALAYARIEVELREVILRSKPAAMLALSPKGTVPVLQLGAQVLDESMDIIHWALDQNDPDGWCDYDGLTLAGMKAMIERCDIDFKPHLDRYKYADRHPQRSQLEYRREAETFVQMLETQLATHKAGGYCLFGPRLSYADIAVFPFVRQFAGVDSSWFAAAPYPLLQAWLARLLASELFLSVMGKYPPWLEEC